MVPPRAAENYLVKALDVENLSFFTLLISPSWVAIDMGNGAAVAQGHAQAPVTVEDSAPGVLSRINAVTKETSGCFWNYKIESGGNPWELVADEFPW
ncbi:hypothetical protein B0H14DRAFT_2355144 [Mycena olivaceomarginata]|nr:hypothetical protein B0H14DRAFT_2355144 [Mycena olivaceomarginata]